MTRLPGWCYAGPDPDGYLSSAALIRAPLGYAASFGAPVLPHTTVLEVTATKGPVVRGFVSSPTRVPGTPVTLSSPQVRTPGPTCRPACLASPPASSW